jgi:phospholipid/cholesterol/gamma-HCH transport system substrate-binding protein
VKISNETKIGVISIVTLTLFILGFNFLKGKKLWDHDTLIYGAYGNVNGLQNSNPVFINGFQVGQVLKISTDKDMRRIVVAMNITKDINIPSNSYAEIKSNPLGTSSVEIMLGNNNTYLKNKDSIGTQASQGMLSDIMSNIKPVLNGVNKATNAADSLLNNFNSVLDANAKRDVAAMLANLNKITTSFTNTSAYLNEMLKTQNGALSKSFENVNGITGNFATNNDEINRVVSNLDKTTARFANLDFKHTLDSLDVAINNLKTLIGSFNNSNGTLGKLINDPTMYQNLASTGNKLNLLLDDIRINPKRYINISVFGKKKTGEALLVPMPDTLNSPYYVQKIKP